MRAADQHSPVETGSHGPPEPQHQLIPKDGVKSKKLRLRAFTRSLLYLFAIRSFVELVLWAGSKVLNANNVKTECHFTLNTNYCQCYPLMCCL